MKKLKDNELDAVSGGDYNDRGKEQSETPNDVSFLYNVGDRVEVFSSDSPVRTKSGTIVERALTNRKPEYTNDSLGCYKVQFDEGGEEWIDGARYRF